MFNSYNVTKVLSDVKIGKSDIRSDARFDLSSPPLRFHVSGIFEVFTCLYLRNF